MVFKRNKRLYDILIYLMLFTSCLTINGQVMSDKDIKSYAEKLNQDITGLILDSKTGMKGRGVISIGRKIIYQYDVPDDWYPFDDIKQVVVKGILDNGNEKFYVLREVDLSYFYFKNDKLFKSLNIDWEEFKTLRFSYADYVDLTNHPKSNGLEFKIKKPLGWELEEGDGPHIVKKFVDDDKMFLVYVNEIGQFFSKKEIQELFESEIDSFLESIEQSFDFKIISHDVYSIENHPFLYVNGIIKQERMGIEISGKTHLWYTFIEDQFVYFMGSNYSQEVDNSYEFYSIMNSLKLLNQY